MKHHALQRFWDAYAQLPAQDRKSADAAYERLKANDRHPSLQLKRIGRLWSVRAGFGFRALAYERGDDLFWFWIGPHDEYERHLRDA